MRELRQLYLYIIAIAAIAMPYNQQRKALKQQQQFDVFQREELSVTLNPHFKGVINVTGTKIGVLGTVVQVPWELTISNAGTRRLSIAGYDLTRGKSPGEMSYSDIDGGLMDLDSKPVGYPITLEAGELRKFFIFVGVTVPDNVYGILEGLVQGHTIDEQVAATSLGANGLDLYGNRVDYREFENGAYITSIDNKNQRGQRFWFTVRTGRDNRFTVSANAYERPAKTAR